MLNIVPVYKRGSPLMFIYFYIVVCIYIKSKVPAPCRHTLVTVSFVFYARPGLSSLSPLEVTAEPILQRCGRVSPSVMSEVL